ncbi:hypothetical protein GLOTRDRAFT_125140 [Gloeophyllum trabeum ATCC 11539]|uniref:Uncharacterized protein n=1 Tax=Gloeophyllum trabeum (strain ATCC 11539 / FP-39264 / Madison 617) TaxID=670483 RepID=S7QHV2_GLOTA|nr:uncharacterized protein GLOTRDRAFT_125140 [Gloeophyllum trabeum ATCC 11539]EPQ58813.1 hypothetical protein GLOTRDRAFT_125140 [Gloeophyllum trabeum ATCC 11539]
MPEKEPERTPEEIQAEINRSIEIANVTLKAAYPVLPDRRRYTMVYGYPVTADWIMKAARNTGNKSSDFLEAAAHVKHILRVKSGIRTLCFCAPDIDAYPSNSEDWLVTFGTYEHIDIKGRWPPCFAIDRVRRMVKAQGLPIWRRKPPIKVKDDDGRHGVIIDQVNLLEGQVRRMKQSDGLDPDLRRVLDDIVIPAVLEALKKRVLRDLRLTEFSREDEWQLHDVTN